MNDYFDNSHVQVAVYITDQGQYVVKAKDNRGAVTVKTVREPEVRAAFTRQGNDSGWLCPGIIRAGNNEQGKWYAYFHAACLVSISIQKMGKLLVPMPATMLVANSGGFRIFALAVDSPARAMNAKLFQMPTPNVHGSGSICWGKNDTPKVDPMTAEKVWELFFRSPFNADLVDGKSVKYPKDVRLMLQELDLKDKYPVKDLKAANDTLRRLLQVEEDL